MNYSRRILFLAATLAALAALPQHGLRANLSGRPVTVIVPFAAGGPTDLVARVIARDAGHGARPAAW